MCVPLPYVCVPLPYMCVPLPYVCVPLPYMCVPLPYMCVPLPYMCVPLPYMCVPLPYMCVPLPYMCVPLPYMCVPLPYVCVPLPHDSVKLIKFADDTTLIGLISNNDESAYRREVDRLVSWCSGNNLELNAQKTVEMIVDFRKSTVPPPPPSVMDSPITSVESFRFLGTTITQDLKWEPTISSLIKKAQQRMYFLRQLRKAKLPAQMLVQFYTAIIESILTSSITVWFAGATVRDKQRLQRIVRSAEEVIGRSLPSLQDLVYNSPPLTAFSACAYDKTFPSSARVSRALAAPPFLLLVLHVEVLDPVCLFCASNAGFSDIPRVTPHPSVGTSLLDRRRVGLRFKQEGV
uniref:Alkylated DNA repair protein AlkB homologue 8 N-terminal domain-containing protein n=1 Tax=Knipowitschia caucasica TaxID=637954 RepID=A0AAV2K5M1_KNICA